MRVVAGEVVVRPGEVGRAVRVAGHARCVRVERDDVHPRPVALAAAHDAPLVHRPDRHQVVLAARHHVPAVRRPADAQQAAEVALHRVDELHRRVVEYPQVAVLADGRDVARARRERELVQAAVTDHPPVERVTRALRLTRVHREAVALLEELVVRRGRAARQLLAVDVQLAAAVRHEELVRRAGQPLDARHLAAVDQPLQHSSTASPHAKQ